MVHNSYPKIQEAEMMTSFHSLLPPQCYKPRPSHQVQSSFSSKLFLSGLPVPFANYAILRFGFNCYYLLEEKTNHLGYCSMMFSEGLRRWYYKVNEKYRATKRTGPSGDATAVVLQVDMICPSN